MTFFGLTYLGYQNPIGDRPNQLYMVPLTESQRYGWMVSKNSEPWMLVRRFPRKNSEMTFAKEMLKTDPNFSLL
uniref:Si:dkey-90a13.10 n=1 Tax=Neolamprologus brichardi TaxID=32507 RepID=A0A3Q4IET9_NEOBR